MRVINANESHFVILYDIYTLALFDINLDITNSMRQLLVNLHCIVLGQGNGCWLVYFCGTYSVFF